MPEVSSDQSISPTAPADAEQRPGAVNDGEIVVTGLRRSLESAAAIKRNSDGIVDAVVAEDIGKLPDTFASAALARVSGITVIRGAGEATGVRVRGLPDLSTTYNGREIFTAEGRSVAIQDFPAGTVAALEVYKSSTANLIEGGIGGQVNVRGRRPFDFSGFQLSGSLNGVNWEESDGLTWNGNLLVSDRWDTGIGEMGLLVNASYVGLNFLDATREQSVVIASTNPRAANGTVTNNAPGQPAGLRYPDAQGLFNAYSERWRPSVNAAFQWRPTQDLEIYADGLFQGYRAENNDRYMFFPIFGAGLQLGNVVLREGTTDIVQSATVSGASVPNGNWRSAKSNTDTYQGGAGFVWDRGGFRLSGDIAYTDSTFQTEVVNIDFALASSPVRNVVFEAPGGVGGPTWNVGTYDLTNPANYIDRGLFQELLRVGGKDIQSRLDAQYEFDDGLIRRIQVGVRYNDRDANRDRGAPYIDRINGQLISGLRIPVTSLPIETDVSRPAFGFDNIFPIRTFVGVSYDGIRNNLADLRAFHGAPEGLPVFSPTENFRANEKAYAAYAQVKYQVDLSDTMSIDGVVGLRAVRTKTQIAGFLRENSTAGPPVDTLVSAEREYDDYLPNVSARVRFTPELQLRLAYTQTRTRPGFFDLNPALTLAPPPVIDPNNPPNPNNPNSNIRTATGGNPNLAPLTSDNYDIALEWYFSRSGSLTGSLFRRDAQGFIARIPTNVDDPTYGLIRVTRPENISQTRFQGVEIAFTSFLDFESLPNWAKGFGVQANATYLDAAGPLAGSIANSVNVLGQSLPFSGTSDWTYNLVALYERPFFSARVAYNYRSDFVTGYSIENQDLNASNQALTNAAIERGRGQLDFAATVTPVRNITLAFDIANLLGNPIRRYRRFGDAGQEFARQFVYNDRAYSLGVRFRF